MPRRLRALVTAPFEERSLDELRRLLDVTYEPWTDTRRLHNPQEMAARLRNEEIAVLVVEADFLTGEVFTAPKLRVAAVCRNALNQVDLKAASARRIPVIHTPARNAPAVAELTIGLMLSLARHIPKGHDYVSSGGWTNPLETYAEFRGRELGGSTVGIVGLGQVGSEVAKRATALGARVIAADPFVAPRRAQSLGVRLVSLKTLLQRADFVTLHTPPAKDEPKLIDAAALDLMQPGAYLINTGAPDALDYDALAAVLRDGRIAGAALDVFPGFLMARDSPVKTLDNVILTPHIGGATGETVVRHSRMIAGDVLRFLSGRRPRNVANPEALKQTRSHGR